MKIKLTICGIILAMSSLSAHSCVVDYTTATTDVQNALKDGWRFKNYDMICKQLNDSNAMLVVTGDATVLGGVSIAWASVVVKDKDSGVFTNSFGGLSTLVNTFASQDKAESMLTEAINRAVDNLSLSKALAKLKEEKLHTFQKK